VTKSDKTEEVMPSPAVPANKFKGKHPVVADGCDVYFNGMKFQAGDEMRSLPEDLKAALFESKRIV
jgi:hypothetical protein